MKKREIIELDNFKNAIPKKKTWYKYFDDTFVSVICTEGRTSHIRNKSQKDYKFIDNRMCYWHCHWQYELIEAVYGNQEKNIKTYEKIIFHNDEKHIIDSVVNNISIEFQHTLSVSIEEMDSRWHSQRHHNYLPFLVLDFTEFLSPAFFKEEFQYSYNSIKNLLKSISKDTTEFKIAKRLLKWTNSEYFKSGNLFIHFEDEMVRFNDEMLFGHIKHKQEEFVEQLNFLEKLLTIQIQNDKIEKEKREELKQQELKIQEENSKIEEQKRIDKLILDRAVFESERIEEQNKNREKLYEEEKRELEEKKKRLVKNNFDKEKNSDFHFFRMILEEPKISKNLIKYNLNEVIFHYDHFSENLNNQKVKHHIYFSEELNLLFIYSTKGFINSLNKYSFVSSEIKIIRREYCEIRTFTYNQNKKEPVKIVEYRSELVLGCLHSLSSYALIIYDIDEKPIDKKHFVFGKIIDDEFYEIVSNSMINNMPLEYLYEEKDLSDIKIIKANELINSIFDKRNSPFSIEEIISNYGINIKIIENYYQDLGIVFKNNLLEKFYICNY